ncbi:hypothetical protein [Vibrio sp. EJY3]|uniref:hypothetical protein n=1 Tax=Vibrio sp. (strain EJY3) TaxID=1116375 RepID=UPI000243B5DC|nr:hypothetical protein [Vibrio sp. EJY3]AEX21970.1 hypothetical protein VEJY3_07400 [Vibrio sp. EJY3]
MSLSADLYTIYKEKIDEFLQNWKGTIHALIKENLSYCINQAFDEVGIKAGYQLENEVIKNKFKHCLNELLSHVVLKKLSCVDGFTNKDQIANNAINLIISKIINTDLFIEVIIYQYFPLEYEAEDCYRFNYIR